MLLFMVTPREQKEMVIAYSNQTKDEFAEAFLAKYNGTMPIMKLTGRIRSLWDCRHVHAIEIGGLKAREEAEKINATQKKYFTIGAIVLGIIFIVLLLIVLKKKINLNL